MKFHSAVAVIAVVTFLAAQTSFVKKRVPGVQVVYGQVRATVQPVDGLVQRSPHCRPRLPRGHGESGVCNGVTRAHQSPPDSPMAAACNVRRMQELGITHIVTVIIGVGAVFPTHFVYHLVPVRDISEDGPSLFRHLRPAVTFIEDVWRDDRALPRLRPRG